MGHINEPVELLRSDQERTPDKGIGICLSGGGYRAMLFHLRSLLRLTEIGYLGSQNIPDELGNLERISSVSGESITSATLGQAWDKVRPGEDGAKERFIKEVVTPIRVLAEKSIDVISVAVGLLPFTSAAARIAAAYRKYIFDRHTLDAFPSTPRFVKCL